MTDLELIEQHLERDLKQRKGEGCSNCQGWRALNPWGPVDTCPDCHGSGHSPAITQAEEALAAVRRVQKGVDFVHEAAAEESERDSGAALLWACEKIDTTKPVTTEAEVTTP